MVLVWVSLVALFGSAVSQRALPLSSITYPTAPLLPIAPIADYGNFFQRISAPSPRVSNPPSIRPASSTRNQYGTSSNSYVSTSSNSYVSTSSSSSQQTSEDLCNPSPCGPNTRCDISPRKKVPVCRCIANYIPDGHTINGCLKPECLSHSECPRNSRCDPDRNKCEEVCSLNTCGFNAECRVGSDYQPVCECRRGYEGNPHVECKVQRVEPISYNPPDPCTPNPCGYNALCRSDGARAVCECLTRFEGDPISGCTRVECTKSEDCYRSSDICQSNKCINACQIPGICGSNTDCTVRNRQPICSCKISHRGDPFQGCYYDPEAVCKPSPCGINTNCRAGNNRAICTCIENHFGDPLRACHPECTRDSDCGPKKGCQNSKCVDLCSHCGTNALCEVRSGVGICRCPEHYLGSPYTRCYPECTTHEECGYNRVCEKYRCADPCKDACGTSADCRLDGRKPVCSCPKDRTGDPFISCRLFTDEDLCTPNPCGQYAECNPGFDRLGRRRPVCTCPVGYLGDPLTYCQRGECVDDSSCPSTQACYQHKCQSTCRVNGRDVCGINADCSMRNHQPVCSCPTGHRGDPLHHCTSHAALRYSIGRSRRLW